MFVLKIVRFFSNYTAMAYTSVGSMMAISMFSLLLKWHTTTYLYGQVSLSLYSCPLKYTGH